MTSPTSSTASATPAGPVISRSEVTWRGERLFDAGPAGRQHRIDAGSKEAPGPVETLLSAIAACASVDVVDIITGLDRANLHLVLAALAHAAGSHEHADVVVGPDGLGHLTRPGPVVAWPT